MVETHVVYVGKNVKGKNSHKKLMKKSKYKVEYTM